MEIQFETEVLKEACLVLVPRNDAIPRAVLSAMRDLYNEMRNAEHMDELVFGQPDTHDWISELEWSVPLAEGYEAILRVNHQKPPKGANGIDTSRVHRVRVMAIEAPHV